MSDVFAVLSRVSEFLSEYDTLSHATSWQTFYAFHASLFSADTFSEVHEALQRPHLDDATHHRLFRLRDCLALHLENARAASALDAARTFETTHQVRTETQTLSFRDALLGLSAQPQTRQRNELESACAHALLDNPSPYQRRIESALATSAQLGFESYQAFRETVTGFSLATLLKACETFLHTTEPAYRDILAYGLKKIDPLLRPSHARGSDLEAVSQALWMREQASLDHFFPIVLQWLKDFGWTPRANKNLGLPHHEGPNFGLHHALKLLRAEGQRLPTRAMADAALREAFGSLFQSFLLDEGFWHRYAKVSRPQAKEMARLVAFHQLFQLRKVAARLPYEFSLYAQGPTPARAEEYAERLSGALQVDIHRGFYLQEVEPHFYGASRLRGVLLSAGLKDLLRHRFNEDFWRNPAAAAFLSSHMAQCVAEPVEKVATLWGAGESLELVAKDWVQILGA